jgi:hypothetical protein
MTHYARVSHAGACALLLLLLLLLLHPPSARSDVSWQQFTPVSSPPGIQKHQALTHAGAVVIIGGCDASGAALPNVWTFDPSAGASGTWTQRGANLPLIWHSASTLQVRFARLKTKFETTKLAAGPDGHHFWGLGRSERQLQLEDVLV